MTKFDEVSGGPEGRGGDGGHGEDRKDGGRGRVGGPVLDGRRVGPSVRLVHLPGAGRWLAALAACLVVVCTAMVSAGTARADTIDGAITSITTTATSTAQWQRVDFACTWAVPDG